MSRDSFTVSFPLLLARIKDREWTAMVELHQQLSKTVFQAVRAITDDDLSAELITIGVFIRVWDRPDSLTGSGAPAGRRALRQALVDLARGRAEAWCADQLLEELDELPRGSALGGRRRVVLHQVGREGEGE